MSPSRRKASPKRVHNMWTILPWRMLPANTGSIARLGYVMVIQANNLRQGLANGSISREQAAETIEPYKAMLWNPKVDELTPGQSTFLPEGSAEYLSPGGGSPGQLPGGR